MRIPLEELAKGLVMALAKAQHDKRLDLAFAGDPLLVSHHRALAIVDFELRRRGVDPTLLIDATR